MQRIQLIESRYIMGCSHLTAASELVADEMARRYSIPRPIPVHNVFSWAERASIDGRLKDRKGPALSLYWFSQTIGQGRGIEDAIRAGGLLEGKVQLHLRGRLAEHVKGEFLSLAKAHGLREIYFHPPVSPQELLSRSVEHDVGLALEEGRTLSRKVSVTNKLFFYLLAGLAVAATDIAGQRYVLDTCPGAGFLYSPGDYRTLAARLGELHSNPDRLRQCKAASLEAAQRHWNWETERRKLTDSIKNLLGNS